MNTVRSDYREAYRYARIFYAAFNLGLLVDRRKMYDDHVWDNGIIPSPIVVSAWDSRIARINEPDLAEQLRDKVLERWTREYKREIYSWGWRGFIVPTAKRNKDDQYSYDPIAIGSCYLGSCLTLSPSGKYYQPFACSNVSELEALRDQCWYAALDSVAESHGGWIESGDGDPTDIYFCMRIE